MLIFIEDIARLSENLKALQTCIKKIDKCHNAMIAKSHSRDNTKAFMARNNQQLSDLTKQKYSLLDDIKANYNEAFGDGQRNA